MVAVIKKRKSKSSQYRFLAHRERELCRLLGLGFLPSRASYFDRYRRAHTLFAKAIELQGRLAIAEGIASPSVCAADKSLIPARGPVWHRHKRVRNIRPRGVDAQAAWGYSPHHDWVWGYGYDVVVTATRKSVVFPLLAGMEAANANEAKCLQAKLSQLPPELLHLLLDSGYDSNELGERVEYTPQGKRTGRRMLCPPVARFGKPAVGRYPHRGKRERSRVRRAARVAFLRGVRGRRLYRQRRKTVEPFNEWFKNLFELDERAWHRGIDNNRTQVLCAMFSYQLLVRYHHRHGGTNAQIQWILDGL